MSSSQFPNGAQLLGGGESRLGLADLLGVDPRSGVAMEPAFHEATAAEVQRSLALAQAAHPAFESAGRAQRASLLEAIAAGIEALGSALLERAGAETGLPRARLESERGRTTAQLRAFAAQVREGSFLDLCIMHGDPSRQPLPKPDLRRMARALGPVVVFGASNFPLAFSVAGGDTAAALAAGCPVVVKGHPNHPGTSELVGRAIVAALAQTELPAGVFALLQGRSHGLGAALVTDPRTRAVAFTGSQRGGRALFDLAQKRPTPIPVFAEMGSINPLFLLPGRVTEDPVGLANLIAASVTLGVGQFCTNPGLLVLIADQHAEALLAALAQQLSRVPEAPLLHAAIHSGYRQGLARLAGLPGVQVRAQSEANGPCGATPALLTIAAEQFLLEPGAQEEVFGPSTLAVLCRDAEQLLAVAAVLEGQLTATLHASPSDRALGARLLPVLTERAGRLLYGGFPTGVEVSEAMVHGGPYPASTDSRSTSVGSAAIRRFLRPVAYQNFPAELLPAELRDAAPPGLLRRVDGTWSLG